MWPCSIYMAAAPNDIALALAICLCVLLGLAFLCLACVWITLPLHAIEWTCVLFGFAQRLDGSAFASEYVHMCTLCLSDCSRKSSRSYPLCITVWSLHIHWYGLCVCIILWSMCLIYIYELGVWYWLVPCVYRMIEWLCVSITLEWPYVYAWISGFLLFWPGVVTTAWAYHRPLRWF